MKYRIASSFGYQSMDPVKTSVAGLLRRPVRVEIRRIHPGRDGPDIGMRGAGGQERAVGLGDRRRSGRPASARHGLVASHLPPFDGEQGPAPAGRARPRGAASRSCTRRCARRGRSGTGRPIGTFGIATRKSATQTSTPAASASRTRAWSAGIRHFQRSAGYGESQERASAGREARGARLRNARRAPRSTRSQRSEPSLEPVGVVGRVRGGDHGHPVPAGQLGDGVQAAEPPAHVERPEPADLHPEDPQRAQPPAVAPPAPHRRGRLAARAPGSAGARADPRGWRCRSRARRRGARARRGSNSAARQGARTEDRGPDRRPRTAPGPSARTAPGSPACVRWRISPRHAVPERLAQDRLRGEPADLEAVGRPYHVLDQLVVQEGHAALDRRGHAHLVLLHQQLDQVCLEIGVAHPVVPSSPAPRRSSRSCSRYGSTRSVRSLVQDGRWRRASRETRRSSRRTPRGLPGRAPGSSGSRSGGGAAAAAGSHAGCSRGGLAASMRQ